MKTWPLALLLLVAGCRGAEPVPDSNGQEAADASPDMKAAPVDDGKIECARGDSVFERICTIERSDSPQGRIITLRNPDGGFRRLLITRDGRGVVAADGAEPARVTPLSKEKIEVVIGRDRYRLSATVRQ